MLLAPEELSARDYSRLSSAVHAHCGINLHEGKRQLVHARLAKLMRNCQCASVTAYLDRVLSASPDAPEFVEFIDALSTNLTSFFREPDHFEFLARELLLDLLGRRGTAAGDGTRRIRAWCAASSTGEEPYSIAMVLQEALEAQPEPWDAKLLATDISTRVLKLARQALYDPARVSAVPRHLQVKYLTRTAMRDGPSFVQPIPRVRALVCFAHLNLLDPWPFTGPLDFVFCRNVMIYFDKPTQQRLISRLWDVLGPGGILFTGHSESLTGIAHKFRYVKPTIYLKA